MAYIAPNSVVEFFGDLGLNDKYDDTLYFGTTADKDSYFSQLPKIVRTEAMSYTRQQRGYIRVGVSITTLLPASYLRYKNTNFENKWFYAFVKNVEYINNECTQVNFEIDPLMTWMGAFSLGECFVERMHTSNDGIGDNIADEGIPVGDYKYESITASGFIGSNGFWYCFASTFDPTNPSAQVSNFDSGEYGGIYSGIFYNYTQDVSTLNGWISAATTAGKSDGIVGISIVPRTFITDKNEPPVERSQTFPKPAVGDSIDGYVPKNNKMYTFPYISLGVTNLEGNYAEFRYEFFSGNSAQFAFKGVTGLQSEILCAPFNYKNVQANVTEKMAMVDFPMCAYATNPFEAYLAQNKSSLTASVVSSALSTVSLVASAGFVTAGGDLGSSASSFNNLGGSIGGLSMGSRTASEEATRMLRSGDIVNTFSNSGSQSASFNMGNSPLLGIANTMAGLADYARKPMQINGSQGTSALFGGSAGSAGSNMQKKDFYFMKKVITHNYAIMIDNFFTMFGYKVNQVLQPSMNNRPYYTYVKTIGCNISGSVPADDLAFIAQLFDRGIRFWKRHDQIGQYNELNNSPA